MRREETSGTNRIKRYREGNEDCWDFRRGTKADINNASGGKLGGDVWMGQDDDEEGRRKLALCRRVPSGGSVESWSEAMHERRGETGQITGQ